MQDERSCDQAILTMLLPKDEQRPWSIREVELEIGDPVEAEDSLARLRGAGLIHRCGEYVWASRAALAAEAIST
jgi:hypothetical protein